MDNDRSLAYPLAPFGRLVHAFDRGPLHAPTPKQCIIKGTLARRRRKDAQELLSSGALPPITQSARQKFGDQRRAIAIAGRALILPSHCRSG
jgi:hypothetical protein